MEFDWSAIIRRHRAQLGLTQTQLARAVGVSQKTVSRWERGEDNPKFAARTVLKDLLHEPDSALVHSLKLSVTHCPAPRALTRVDGLVLEVLSPAARAKRPSIVNFVGRSLRPLASGVLQTMLDDRALQLAIARHEIAAVVATTRSVLDTPESPRIGCYRTTISYYRIDGVLYGDAISVPVQVTQELGYRAVAFDELALA